MAAALNRRRPHGHMRGFPLTWPLVLSFLPLAVRLGGLEECREGPVIVTDPGPRVCGIVHRARTPEATGLGLSRCGTWACRAKS